MLKGTVFTQYRQYRSDTHTHTEKETETETEKETEKETHKQTGRQRESEIPNIDGNCQLFGCTCHVFGSHRGVVPVTTATRFIVVVVDHDTTTNV